MPETSVKGRLSNKLESFDKLKSLAEKAENNDFFGDFYDKTSNPVSITNKLLPTRLDSKFDMIPENKPQQNLNKSPGKPKNNTKIFELEEEDLIL